MQSHLKTSDSKVTTTTHLQNHGLRLLWSVRTLRLIIPALCAALLFCCVVMLKPKDTSTDFSKLLPTDAIYPYSVSAQYKRMYRKGHLSGRTNAMTKAPDGHLISENDSPFLKSNSGENGFVSQSLEVNKYPQTTTVTVIDNHTVTSGRRQEKGRSHRLPGAIIIGVRKGGTKALIEFLNIHPQVVAATDETHFFSDDDNYGQGMHWYLNKMPMSLPDQITMEKTPKYFISQAAPDRIHSMNSSIRLVLALRNPVTRVISDFAQRVENMGDTGRNFTEYVLDNTTWEVKQDVLCLTISIYHLHLARWLQLFPLKQIHIVDGDRLISEPLEELKGVERFLGIPRYFSEEVVYFNATRGFYCMKKKVHGLYTASCLGATKGRDHPHVEGWVRDKLVRYFDTHNEKLFRMIGRRFNWS